MSVTLNEQALRRLLESQDGPVGQDLAGRAQRVVDAAQVGVARIMARSPIRPQVAFQVERDAEGLLAVIGLRDEGRVARYLAGKETRERVWLVPALAAGFAE